MIPSKTYPVKPRGLKDLKVVLYWLIALFLFFSFELWLAHQGHGNVENALRNLTGLVFFSAIFLGFLYYSISKGNRFLPTRYEVSPEGLRRVGPYGAEAFLGWDEIADIESRNLAQNLSIRPKTPGVSMSISAHMDDFQELVDRIRMEFEARTGKTSPAGTKFEADPGKVSSSWIAFAFFLFIAALGPITLILLYHGPKESFQNEILFIMLLGILCPLLFGSVAFSLAKTTLETSRTFLVLDNEGIGSWAGNDRKTFIRWDDIGDLKTNFHSSAVIVQSGSNHNSLKILYDYRDFMVLKNDLCERFLRHLPRPTLPSDIGHSQVVRYFFGLELTLLVGGFFGWLVLFKADTSTPGNQELGFLMAGGLGFLIGLVNYKNFTHLERAKLDSDGITLFGILKKVHLPFERIEKVEWGTLPSTVQLDRDTFLLVTDKSGKKHKVVGELSFRLRLKAFLDGAIRGTA